MKNEQVDDDPRYVLTLRDEQLHFMPGHCDLGKMSRPFWSYISTRLLFSFSLSPSHTPTFTMKDITNTVNDVCHVFLRDKLCHKVAHAHVHNHSNSNVNMCTCGTLQQSFCTVGYCLYGTLLLRLRSACPVQIRVHHHTDVYTDINE